MILAAFGLLTLLAVIATWRDEDLRWVGLWLLASYGLSNILHATLLVIDLPGPYSMIEFMVLLATGVAWDAHRRYWPLLVLMGINILSICINIAFAAHFPPAPRHIYSFELTTNLCFTAECLLATGVGLYDGLRNGRFGGLSRLWGRFVAAPTARTEGHDQ